jgi:UPF0755 protein
MNMTGSNKKTKRKKLLAVLLLLFLLAGTTATYLAYAIVLKPNLELRGQNHAHFYIPTGSTYQDVYDQLQHEGLIRNLRSFAFLAERKNYPNRVMPGRYRLHHRMGNNELINLLRSGNQDPVMVTFNNMRTKEQLAGNLSKQLEADSLSILRLMNDTALLESYGMTPHTAPLLFLPNTYEFFWDASAQQILDRMYREYQAFWNDSRLRQAREAGLSPVEAGILASIVERETSKVDEMARIAGVYINRLRRNMPLQADPTVVFAVGDFSITRVLNHHLAVDSPYNTYRNSGLPPGPISLPEPRVIDQVLQHESHNYLFFCALDDFSGYHAFARTYTEHLANARRYQQALNKRRIMN